MSNGSIVVDIEATEKQMGCSSIVSESVSTSIPEDSADLNSSSKKETVVRNSENRSSDAGDKSVIDEKNKSWVVDVKCGDDENCDGDKLCRICHLNSEQPWKLPFFTTKNDLIVIGCECKGELSVAHSYCAEAWFKLKGNRICEICGVTANNVRGVGNERFMEEWKENRRNGNAIDSSTDNTSSAEGCWNGQPLCNFLMACLVIAFVLPWFFRINMF